jgi:hypothetical protein
MAFLVWELIGRGETVMWLDLEDTFDPLRDRLRQLGLSDDAIRQHVVFIAPEEEFSDANVGRLIATIRQRGVTHVVIDSLGEAFSLEGLNENLDVEVAPWLRRVCRRIIAKTGAGITLIDHGTKAAEKPLDPSGSKRKKAAITGTAWLMTSEDPFTAEAGGTAWLRCAKDRHGQYRRGATVAKLTKGAVDLLGHCSLVLERVLDLGPTSPDTNKRFAARRAVLETMRKAKAALSETEIIKRSTGVSDSYLRAEFLALVDDGVIVEHDVVRHPANGHRTSRYVLAP